METDTALPAHRVCDYGRLDDPPVPEAVEGNVAAISEKLEGSDVE